MAAKPITSDPVVIETSARLCQCIAAQIELLNKAIKAYDQKIKEKVMQHADYEIVKDLPGVGDKSCARIIASSPRSAMIAGATEPSKPSRPRQASRQSRFRVATA